MSSKIYAYLFLVIWFMPQFIFAQLFQFVYDDTVRTYRVYEPALPLNPNGYPLVIGLHGVGSTAIQFIGNAALRAKADSAQFIVACPNALRHPVVSYFNAGGDYEQLTDSTDDLGFISAVIDTMIKNYSVDSMRIYVMGHSNGAIMAYRVAAELSQRVAAIAANSGQMVYEYCNPQFPVPLIHMHGLQDSICPYGGFSGPNFTLPPVDTTMAIWRGINGCSSIPDTIYNHPGIIGKRWASASGLSDIQLYTIANGGHQWPKVDSLGISATEVFWDFLSSYDNSITEIKGPGKNPLPRNFKLYPNYPNPFNPVTRIQFVLPNAADVEIRVYNVLGQEKAVLLDARQSAGMHTVEFDGRSFDSGVYFYEIHAGSFQQVRKMLLIR